MRIVLSEVFGRCDLRSAGVAAERVGRRNVTLSPAGGTPVVLESRSPRQAAVAAVRLSARLLACCRDNGAASA